MLALLLNSTTTSLSFNIITSEGGSCSGATTWPCIATIPSITSLVNRVGVGDDLGQLLLANTNTDFGEGSLGYPPQFCLHHLNHPYL